MRMNWKVWCIFLCTDFYLQWAVNNKMVGWFIPNFQEKKHFNHVISPQRRFVVRPIIFTCIPLRTNLTHWAQDKMVDSLQMAFSSLFFEKKMCIFFIKVSLNFIPKDLIDDKPALVQIMGWHRTGAKPLSEPMMAFIRLKCVLTHKEVCCPAPHLHMY